jgi:hypothetical protein
VPILISTAFSLSASTNFASFIKGGPILDFGLFDVLRLHSVFQTSLYQVFRLSFHHSRTVTHTLHKAYFKDGCHSAFSYFYSAYVMLLEISLGNPLCLLINRTLDVPFIVSQPLRRLL